MSSTKLLALQREQQRTGGQGVRPLSTSFSSSPDAAPVHDVLGELNGANTIRRVGGATPFSLAADSASGRSSLHKTPLPLMSSSSSSRAPAGTASSVSIPSALPAFRGPVPSSMPRIRAPTSGLVTPSASAAMRRPRTPQPPPPPPTVSVSHPDLQDDALPSPSTADSSSSLFPRIKAKLTDASRTRKKPLPGPAHVVTPHKLGVYRGAVAEESFLSSEAIREFDSGGEDDEWSMVKDQDDAFWDEGAGTSEKENVKVSIRCAFIL